MDKENKTPEEIATQILEGCSDEVKEAIFRQLDCEFLRQDIADRARTEYGAALTDTQLERAYGIYRDEVRYGDTEGIDWESVDYAIESVLQDNNKDELEN